MAASQGVNVLRYSALVAGLVYGFYHQSSITASTRRAEADREYARQERLIEQAKAEWKKKTQPQDSKSTGGVITDPEDPKFDLETFLKLKAGEL
ncbi:ATP synthase subunit e [Aspergillus mulundensis]|uniref:ATP synthase F(0) complex subunit e, mitochondrial n=1 Tax=Aspergillus mulundensis TaxID=1810919 RepID=A0A3D8S618_9EURO|nr:Uncharacterized protein DSM5745_05314 [Aspergillus mulundensis]RDW81757.1 Uncharacterized protein DSM5745_05314 [Aspergillus mulundensis]